jgi:hypothetical protein
MPCQGTAFDYVLLVFCLHPEAMHSPAGWSHDGPLTSSPHAQGHLKLCTSNANVSKGYQNKIKSEHQPVATTYRATLAATALIAGASSTAALPGLLASRSAPTRAIISATGRRGCLLISGGKSYRWGRESGTAITIDVARVRGARCVTATVTGAGASWVGPLIRRACGWIISWIIGVCGRAGRRVATASLVGVLTRGACSRIVSWIVSVCRRAGGGIGAVNVFRSDG